MPTAPLATVEDVLNTARVRLNDAIANLSGDILTDGAPFTLTYVNAAWIRLQELLVNLGVPWLKPEVILPNIGAVASIDTGSQVWLDWTGYNNSSSTSGATVLPQDLIAPMALWERAAGSNGVFFPMDKLDNGLPAVTKKPLNKSWEWRNGRIYMPGANSVTDLRIRYAASYPDFITPGTISFHLQFVPIVRSLNAFAWFICSEVAKARGDVDAGDFDMKAQAATRYIFDLDPVQARSIQKESEYQRMTDEYTPIAGPTGQRGTKGA